MVRRKEWSGEREVGGAHTRQEAGPEKAVIRKDWSYTRDVGGTAATKEAGWKKEGHQREQKLHHFLPVRSPMAMKLRGKVEVRGERAEMRWRPYNRRFDTSGVHITTSVTVIFKMRFLFLGLELKKLSGKFTEKDSGE